MHAKRMQHLFVLRNGSTCNSSIEKDKPHIYHGGAPRLVQHASVVVLVVRCYPSRAKVFEPKCPPHHTTIMDGFNDPSHKYAWNIQYTTGQKSALGIVRVSHNQDNNSVTWIFKRVGPTRVLLRPRMGRPQWCMQTGTKGRYRNDNTHVSSTV